MRFACIVNTRSGGRKGLQFIGRLKGERVEPHQIEIFEVGSHEDYQRLAQSGHFDRILIAGGDGTISSFLNYFSDSTTPICIFPLGTGNDLARQLGLSGDLPEENLADLFNFYAGLPNFELDIWRLSWSNGQQSRKFINYASFGYDGEVVKFFHLLRETLGGFSHFLGRIQNRVFYLLAGVRSLCTPCIELRNLNQGESEIVLKGKLRTLFFSNISSVMGMAYFKPASNPTDHVIELRCIRSALSYLLLPTGTYSSSGLFSGASHWEFEFSKEVFFQVDGEDYSKFAAKSFVIEYSGSRNFCGRRPGPEA